MTQPAEHGISDSRGQWLALTAIVVGTTVVSLDSTIVNVALPSMGRSLRVSNGIEWVVTAYLLGVSAVQPATGWLASRFGRRAVFTWSVAIFTVASLGCALSQNLGTLVTLRALQGLGGGAIIPISQAIVFQIFPKHLHGRAISTWGMAGMIAPAFGPTAGGWLVTELSWHWLFLINLPIGVGAVLLSRRVIPYLSSGDRQPLDGGGLVMGAVGLAVFVLGVSEASNWGWGSPATLTCLVVGLATLVWFGHRCLTIAHPVLAVSLMRERSLQIVIVALVFAQITMFTRLVFIPLELSDVRGYTPLHIGVLLMPGAFVMVLCLKYGGWLIDRLGVRKPAVLGLSLTFVGTLALTQIDASTPDWVLILLICVQSGFGFAVASNIVAGLTDLPSEMLAQATALRQVAIQATGALSVGALATVLAAVVGTHPTKAQYQHGYNVVFLVGALMSLPAIAASTRLPESSRQGGPGAGHEGLATALID